MMEEKIRQDMQKAMRAKDLARLSTIRMISAALQGKQIEKRAKVGDQNIKLSDEEVLIVLRQEAKKRQDSVAEYTKAGREELVKKEKEELDIIQKYLPSELTDEELTHSIKKVFQEQKNITPADFGKSMGLVMKEIRGRASGERVAIFLKKYLSEKE